MQIHELTQRPKKINEDLKSFFGLNNPVVAQVWDQMGGELMQDLAARFTKDSRYANMPLAQRKTAMAADQNIQQISKQKLEEWNAYIKSVETKNRGVPLTDAQYEAAFMNWINQSLYNGQYASLDQDAKRNAQMIFRGFMRYRNEAEPKKTQMQADHLKMLIADETARMLQVQTDLQRAQAATGTTPAGTQQGAQTTPGYAKTTYNAPVATVPQTTAPTAQTTAPTAPRATVPATQQTQVPGYGAVKTNVPVAAVPKVATPRLNPQQVKQIASKASKATA